MTERSRFKSQSVILGVEDLPEPIILEDGIKAFPWHIDTKYYTADVNLCSVEKKTLDSEEFAVSVEAVIINFDSNINAGLNIAESWLSFLKEFEPEVQILLCDRCQENPSVGVSKVAAQEWCVDQGFELVELDPELDAEWEAEQDFIETTGIQRVVQAVHSHLWPNLRMKGKPQQLSKTVQSMLNGNDLDPTLSTLGQDLQNLQLDPVNNSNNYNANVNTAIEDRIDELLGDSGGVAGFSSLFEQLHNMKACVQGLPSDQRKACAEQVVMAFWHAIGGDEDELEGLGGADGGT
uniref:Alpha-and gamma-adaptin-binding protein p34 n=2 Tax=Timema TaxID=61471 RepID=A0A7R9B146_TIMSH|nr:unnamed protein product [Timema shepardi]CAD7574189.1 unnamed protein product [Timema californicum]